MRSRLVSEYPSDNGKCAADRHRIVSAQWRDPDRCCRLIAAFSADHQRAIGERCHRFEAGVRRQVLDAGEHRPRRRRAKRAVAIEIVDADGLRLLEAHGDAAIGQLRDVFGVSGSLVGERTPLLVAHHRRAHVGDAGQRAARIEHEIAFEPFAVVALRNEAIAVEHFDIRQASECRIARAQLDTTTKAQPIEHGITEIHGRRLHLDSAPLLGNRCVRR